MQDGIVTIAVETLLLNVKFLACGPEGSLSNSSYYITRQVM